MSFFRSDPVGHYKLVIPRESAWHIMSMLGQLDMIHFVKSPKLIENNPFTSQIKRCEESLQKINSLMKVIWQEGIHTPSSYFTQQQLNHISELIRQKQMELQKQKSTSILNEVEEQVHQLWNTYNGMKLQAEALRKKVEFDRENIAIIIAGQRIFGMQRFIRSVSDFNPAQSYFGQAHQNQGVLRVKYGIIEKAEQQKFQRTVFRITRGHIYVKFIPLGDIFEELSPSQTNKSIYFLVFQGKNNSCIQRKIMRLIEPFNKTNGSKYQIPHDAEEYQKIIKKLSKSYNESEHLLKMVDLEVKHFFKEKLMGSNYHHHQKSKIFKRFQQVNFLKCSKLEKLKIYLIKELEIYTHLKQMDIFPNFMQAEIYVRYSDFEELKLKLIQFEKMTRHPPVHIIPIDQAPGRSHKKPTSFHVNSYTRSAQEIVETYGIAKYREANPSLFTTVTFPFLFGVMFGDIGHGLLLFIFGLIMIFKKYKMAEISELFIMVIPHRYLFALMGFFSMYCGFVYNDFLSINLNLFGSCYNPSLVQEHQAIPRQEDCIYPFGVDPVWSVAENNLNYINSLKMKISVIIGVVHMTLGVLIKCTNSLYYRRKVEFWFETIPQLIFLVFVFGYMDFLIIFKWLKPWGYGNPHAPSIITTMINLPLGMGKTDKECCHGGEPMWGLTGDTSQDSIQKFILVVALLCVPIMLLVKPIYMINSHKEKPKKQVKKEADYSVLVEEDDDNSIKVDSHSDDEDVEDYKIENTKNPLKMTSFKSMKELERDMDSTDTEEEHSPSELFVHQMIETIEFVLGCISNTASYLRLWALSLAHSQLAEVFMEKTLVNSFEDGYIGVIGMVIFFPMFAAATFGVLMCMDVMECFLHTLRLHWVEFQNKFYKGDGYSFVPYSFLEKINEEIRKSKFEGQPQKKKE